MLGAVGGIMIADYFIVRKMRLDLKSLYQRNGRYEYSSGFNWIAIVALALAIAPNVPGFLAKLDVIKVSELWINIYDRAWFVGFFISASVYTLGMKIMFQSDELVPAEK